MANTHPTEPTTKSPFERALESLEDKPFGAHLESFLSCYPGGVGVAWSPSMKEWTESNVARFMKKKGFATHAALHQWTVSQPAEFWKEAAEAVSLRFRTIATDVLDLSRGVESPTWFAGAQLNIAESCFQAAGEQVAIRYQDFAGTMRSLSYAQLDALSNRVANGLEQAGFGPGNAIAIDMPMTVESVAIYLGIIKMGGVAVSIADSFAPEEIQTRLRLSHASAIFTQDVLPRAGKALPLYAKVCDAQAPRAIVVRAGLKPLELRTGDMDWESFLSADSTYAAHLTTTQTPINILFSSGTTGEPKVIPWTQITPLKCASDGYFHQDIREGDVVAWPTNLGWMMGPWLIFAALMNKATMALCYEAPLGEAFGRFVEKAGVTMLGLVPSLAKHWRSTGCMEGFDWSRIRCFSSTGECSNAEDYLYLMYLAGYRPVIEYCGGTEIGGGFITGSVVLPATPGAFSTPALGSAFCLLDENNKPSDSGELFLIPPSVGLSTELLNRDHHEIYYKGTPQGPQGEVLRRHGDQFEKVGDVYRGHGRVDDTMNLGGIKVSSAEIERILNTSAGVQETAAVAVSPAGGGPSQLVVFTVLNEKRASDALLKEFQTKIKSELNPLFKIHDLRVVDVLPRTASNKVMRRVLRKQYP